MREEKSAASAARFRARVESAIAEDEPVPHRGLEVDDWDALEQARVVAIDDDYDH